MITREKIGGIIGTVLFMVLLFLILLFSVFTLSSPPEQLEGIPVMFGSTENARGIPEPTMSGAASVPSQSPDIPPYSPVQPLITQTTEPTIDVEAEREEERRRAQLAAERRAQEEAERRQREEEARRREINRQMSGLFGEGSGGSVTSEGTGGLGSSGNTQSRGNTQGEGVQGVSSGNAAQGASSGNGGIGSYDLGGRSLGRGGLTQPKYTVNDYGTVVVNITVDPDGNVIHAEIGRGTDTPNSTLRNEALRAAQSTRFNAINAANNQRGTITYRFNLK